MAARVRARRVGVVFMLMALAGSFLVLRPAGASAQDADVSVESSALYAFPPTDALPSLLVSEVPPGVVCLVEPQLCPEELDPITKELLTPLLGQVLADAEPLPFQFVPPGEIAVSIFAGAQRYMTALKFALPEVPEGEEIDSFTLTFEESQPTFSLSSPLFRQAVLASVAQVGDTDSAPDVFLEELQKGLANENEEFPPVDPETRLGIEVCPLTASFEDSPAPMSQSEDEIPRDENDEFALDCLRGANGVLDTEAGTWTFDLTFAAQAWADGSLENHGILFRNQSADNLAFGDPDLSAFHQTVLATTSGVITMESSPPPPPLPSLPPPPAVGGGDVGQGGGAVSPPAAGSGGSPATDEPQQPQVADDETPVASDDGPVTETAASEVTTPTWWIVLLILLFVAGWILTQWSLNASVESVTARGGALARLTQRSTDRSDPPTTV